MFVKETHFSSCFGLGNVAKNVKTVSEVYVHVPFGSVCPCFLRGLCGPVPAMCTPALGGGPRAHLASPALTSRREQADMRTEPRPQPGFLHRTVCPSRQHMEAELKKTQWLRCLATGARRVANAPQRRAPRGCKAAVVRGSGSADPALWGVLAHFQR